MNEKIDWESFRGIIERGYKQTDPSKGGRPAYNGEDFYGVKNHLLIENEPKLIKDFQVTPAQTPDWLIGEETLRNHP